MITENLLSSLRSCSGVRKLSSFSRIFCVSRFSVLKLSLQNVICLFTRSHRFSKVLLCLWAAGLWNLEYVDFGCIPSLIHIWFNIIDIFFCLNIFFNPFKLPYRSYDIWRELVDKPFTIFFSKQCIALKKIIPLI